MSDKSFTGKGIQMPTERARLLELALESLLGRKNQIDLEISEITRELEGGRARRTAGVVSTTSAPARASAIRKRSRFSREERHRRSARMKAYWENWRKQRKQKNQ